MSTENFNFLTGLLAGILVTTVVCVYRLFPRPYEPTRKIDDTTTCNHCASPPRSPVRRTAQSVSSTMEMEFRVNTSKLQDLVKHFVVELTKGLALPNQTVKALPSFITRRPQGNEVGTYLTLDLGGTNLRVCEVVLEGHGKNRMRQKKYSISEELKTSNAAEFFDYIAEIVSVFLEDSQADKGRAGQKAVALGFTFSYPLDQKALNVGTLMQWNKGFDVKGVVGEDVVALMAAAFKRKSLNINIVAIVNDTVGTLVAHSYTDPETFMGVIVGTGTNAAYVEKLDAIPKWSTHYCETAADAGGSYPVKSHIFKGEMIINVEWGGFDDEKVVLPISRYDIRLDKSTENPGKQLFEKMISGLYLGEIARFAILDLVHSGELFNGKLPHKMTEQHSFETQFMSRIERDHSLDLGDTKALLEDIFDTHHSTPSDRRIVKRVCELVGIRAARLSAAAVAGVLTKMNRLNGCTVAIDGSVFEHYPHFRNRMTDALHELFGMSADNVVLELARDGSSVGPALVAAIMSPQ